MYFIQFINSILFLAAVADILPKLFLLFYGDPGSGAMLWQMIAAFFVGGMFYASFAFRRVKTFVRKAFGLADEQMKITKNPSSNIAEK